MRLVQIYHPASMPAVSSLDHIKHFLRVLGETEIPSTPFRCIEIFLSIYKTIKTEHAPLLTPHGLCSALYSKELGVQPPPKQSKAKTEDAESADNNGAEINEHKNNAQNKILYGPPGTGKTFDTRRLAVSMAEPDWFLELEEQEPEDSEFRSQIMQKHDELENQQRIVFVTVHQSLSYEDFIEGIRASTNDGTVFYDIEDGLSLIHI